MSPIGEGPADEERRTSRRFKAHPNLSLAKTVQKRVEVVLPKPQGHEGRPSHWSHNSGDLQCQTEEAMWALP